MLLALGSIIGITVSTAYAEDQAQAEGPPAEQETASGGVAVVRSTVVDGNPGVRGSQFTIAIRVEENATGQVPIAAALRVWYNSKSVALDTIERGELGMTVSGRMTNEAGPSGTDTVRRFANLSNFSRTDPDAVIALLTFTVLEEAELPFTVVVEADPATPRPLIDNVPPLRLIPHTFDNSALIDLGEEPEPELESEEPKFLLV